MLRNSEFTKTFFDLSVMGLKKQDNMSVLQNFAGPTKYVKFSEHFEPVIEKYRMHNEHDMSCVSQSYLSHSLFSCKLAVKDWSSLRSRSYCFLFICLASSEGSTDDRLPGTAP